MHEVRQVALKTTDEIDYCKNVTHLVISLDWNNCSDWEDIVFSNHDILGGRSVVVAEIISPESRAGLDLLTLSLEFTRQLLLGRQMELVP